MLTALVLALGLCLTAILALCLARALAPSCRRAPPPAPALAEESLAAFAGVEAKLARAIAHPTVSRYEAEREDGAAFSAFVAELRALFPLAASRLDFETLGDRAVLLAWRGRDEAAKPAILCAHYDVVPADDAAAWRHPPFSGELAEGAVWGRGSQDVKLTLVCALEAAERLLARGFRPRRTLYFAFGGDEEVGGERGAGRIARTLAERGVRASFLLDEGGPVAVGMVGFADRPLALVGVAEKGYIDVLVEAEGRGGHASMPPRRTASGDLARAVAAIEASPSPARLTRTVHGFLDRLCPYVPFGYRLLFRNRWLFGRLILAAFSASPSTNALVGTTAAPTMLAGSSKENVLADRASAIVNVRILPGEGSPEVLDRLSRIVARHGARARAAHPENVVEPHAESPVDHEGFRAIEAALARSFPEAAAVPFLFSAGTDTKHYGKLAEAIYRLTPIAQTAKDLEGIHGRDERVEVGNLRRCLAFYEALIAEL